MTNDQSSYVPRDEPLSVVVGAGSTPGDTPPALELRGTVDIGRIEAALDEVTVGCPQGPVWRYRLHRHGPRHHMLTLTAADATDAGTGSGSASTPDVFPAGLFADLLTARPTAATPTAEPGHGPQAAVPVLPPGPVAGILEPSPLQRELLAEADARPGAGCNVEQLTWDWHGPLDPERFAAAWQSVFDRESVLRAAFDDGPEPRIVLHEQVTPEVVRLPYGAGDWPGLVEHDRRRGVDPRRPGPLRITVVEGEPAQTGVGFAPGSPHRVLLTYHHALLDGLSVRLLLPGFFRAYLADGRLPGGDRRPDLGDYLTWLAAQDLGPAREFWSRAAPPASAVVLPLPPRGPAGHDTCQAGTGRARLRLTSSEADRLSAWAAGWGGTEFSALQAVWALLLYRASGAEGAVPVTFSVTVSGRGIPLESVERLPGALRNPLPVSVKVDPTATVPHLLAALRDQALDMAAYEWISAGQIHTWTHTDHPASAPATPGRCTADGLGMGAVVRPGVGGDAAEQGSGGQPLRSRMPGSLLVFKSSLQPSLAPSAELAAQGIRVSEPAILDADTAFPFALVAHRDSADGLVLSVSHDLTEVPDATNVLADGGRLLRELPYSADESTTIGQILDALAGDDVPLDPEPLLRTLRPAAYRGAGTVCLLPVPDLPDSCYDPIARRYPGPEALVLLSTLPDSAEARSAALAALATIGGRLVLGAFSGAGAAAYEIVRLIAADGGRPPLVVLTRAATPVDELARVLGAAVERAG
ncbi:condensation domain-containing protein [Streptomyces flavidovirens]|uniref:condensation domain-containing protein n=1 Tax=Streptomyces flavidovirens TaxID=67298 RepID=UPI0034245128